MKPTGYHCAVANMSSWKTENLRIESQSGFFRAAQTDQIYFWFEIPQGQTSKYI